MPSSSFPSCHNSALAFCTSSSSTPLPGLQSTLTIIFIAITITIIVMMMMMIIIISRLFSSSLLPQPCHQRELGPRRQGRHGDDVEQVSIALFIIILTIITLLLILLTIIIKIIIIIVIFVGRHGYDANQVPSHIQKFPKNPLGPHFLQTELTDSVCNQRQMFDPEKSSAAAPPPVLSPAPSAQSVTQLISFKNMQNVTELISFKICKM